MSSRPKRTPTLRPEIHKPAAERCEQIREQIRAGVTRPKDIAAAIGCSLDLVRYYGRRMPEIVYNAGKNAGRRHHIEFMIDADVYREITLGDLLEMEGEAIEAAL